jgi:hypothetical protein
MYRNQFEKDFDFTTRWVKIAIGVAFTFIALVWIGIIAFWIFAGSTAIKAADQVEQKGLKAVIEQIWCGPEKKCL